MDSHLTALPLFDIRFQSKLLEIKTKVEFINSEIAQVKFYFEKTFDTLTTENRSILEKNRISSYRNLGNQARLTVELIEELLPIKTVGRQKE